MKTLISVLTQGLKMASSIRLLAFVAMLALSSIAQAAEQKITTYYHVDELGTPIAATNESGETLWRNFNSPYGVRYTKPNLEGAVDAEGANYESTGESTAALNRIGFTGHVEDKIDGRQLIYMQARFYDPAIGRFLSPDPVGFNDGNLMSFNRYSYVSNNPLLYIDPDGREIKLTDKAQASEIGPAYEELKSDPITGPMIQFLDDADELYTISTLEENRSKTGFQNFLNAITFTDPKTALNANYLDKQRIIEITPGIRAEVFDFKTKTDFVIPFAGVLAHEIGHAFVHAATGKGRGRGGQTETQIHQLVDNPKYDITRSRSGTFLPPEKTP